MVTSNGEHGLQLLSPLGLAHGRERVPGGPETKLSLRDGRTGTVNGTEVQVPHGIARRVTAGAIKALAGLYRGMILFMAVGDGWQRLQDTEVVDLSDRQDYRAEDPPRPAFTATPRLNLD